MIALLPGHHAQKQGLEIGADSEYLLSCELIKIVREVNGNAIMLDVGPMRNKHRVINQNKFKIAIEIHFARSLPYVKSKFENEIEREFADKFIDEFCLVEYGPEYKQTDSIDFFLAGCECPNLIVAPDTLFNAKKRLQDIAARFGACLF